MAKPVVWLGDSQAVVRSFPKSAKVAIGNALFAVQHGERPIDSKSMKTIGPGVAEIRAHDEDSNQFRVIYVAKIAGAVHVLHAFEKKDQKTRKTDIQVAATRLRELRQEAAKERK